MTTYDAALPKGTEPREGHEPRPRTAAQGSELDAVYASRYTVMSGDIAEGVSLDVSFDHHAAGDDHGHELEVAAAINDETPPEARRHVTGTPED